MQNASTTLPWHPASTREVPPEIGPSRLLKAGHLALAVLGWGVSFYAASAACVLAFDLRTTIFFSDYEAILSRYAALQDGAMPVWDFVLSKQVDHNHALVFLLGLVDIATMEGRQHLLTAATLIANLGFFFALGIWIWRAKPLGVMRSFLILLVAAHVFSGLGGETWFFPFQCVLTTFRPLALLSIILFVQAVTQQELARNRYSVGAACLAFGAFLCHGAAVILTPVLIVWACLLRAWRQLLFLGPALFAQIAIDKWHPSGSPVSTATLLASPLHHPLAFFEAVPQLLGFFGAAGPNHLWLNRLVGSVAVTAFVWLGCDIMRQWHVEKRGLLFAMRLGVYIWGSFGLLGTLLSVVGNLGYAATRGADIYNPYYYISNRYMITVSTFWLSLAILGATRAARIRSMWPRWLVAAIVLLQAAAIWHRGTKQIDMWAETHRGMRAVEAMVASGAIDAFSISHIKGVIGLPHYPDDIVAAYPRLVQQLHLGPLAPGEQARLQHIASAPEATVRVLDITSIEPLQKGLSRVHGPVDAALEDSLSRRPFPLSDETGHVVGVAFVDEALPLHRAPDRPLGFTGYGRFETLDGIRATMPSPGHLYEMPGPLRTFFYMPWRHW